jgi:hypothetical protein
VLGLPCITLVPAGRARFAPAGGLPSHQQRGINIQTKSFDKGGSICREGSFFGCHLQSSSLKVEKAKFSHSKWAKKGGRSIDPHPNLKLGETTADRSR